ncbi:thiamine phosphate synthase [Uliginosibacterium sp. H1]|uniref:thiamine phosphate synthase n=1 Tax=Uliginosibacterium sp. H1 TaxID=3114757 RepID=UPI002E19FB39|nr:thiamine phosphate synthase [Uliginosibacterium sp. H1]
MELRRGLYLVTPDWDDTARLLDVSRAAIEGGATCLQYRHKHAEPAQRLEQAAALAALCKATGTCFIVNDDLDLALTVDADGVHIGRDDGDLAAIRARAGAGFIVGVSCYNEMERARAAAAGGAAYVAFGAMYPSSTKPHAVAASRALIGRARDELGLPVVCIGGITADNAPPLVAAGADLLAVITDIYNAADPRAQAARFAALFTASPAA